MCRDNALTGIVQTEAFSRKNVLIGDGVQIGKSFAEFKFFTFDGK
jgi:hypothetical protein